MWDLLSRSDREILANFVRACTLLIYRIIDNNMLNEAHDRLLKVGQLIEEHYGQQLITSNIHLFCILLNVAIITAHYMHFGVIYSKK